MFYVSFKICQDNEEVTVKGTVYHADTDAKGILSNTIIAPDKRGYPHNFLVSQ